MATGDLIRNGDFCEIVTDKFLSQGVKRGHLVFVAGHKALPEDENDPYTQRIKFLCQLVKEDHVEKGGKIYIIDPLSLLKVKENRQEHLSALFKEDFEDSTN